jgi:hypothetical protein
MQTCKSRKWLDDVRRAACREVDQSGRWRVVGPMRKLLLALLILSTVVTAADARHRRHWFDSRSDYGTQQPSDPASDEPANQRTRGGPTVASLIPSTWTAEPPRKDWDGKRFVSPDGASWVALYKSAVGSEPIADHMKGMVFAPGETVTYLRGERTWVAVSGYKDSHAFYRKAMLVCAGTAWNHVALEYPIESKNQMEPMAAAIAQALDNTQADCGTTAAKPN